MTTYPTWALTFAFIGAVALAGCGQGHAETLEANFAKTVEVSGSNSERCSAAREVADAFSREGNEQKYSDWQVKAAMSCARASVDP